MRQITKAITIICVMSSCGSTMKVSTETLPVLQLAPVTTQAVILNAHEALQEDLATTTTTEAPLVSDPLDYIDESRAMYGQCGEWYDTLIAVGGRAEDWPIWSRVLWTESRCIPAPGKNPATADCIGLTQIFFRVHQAWLSEFGFSREDLLDPVKNLTFAVALQKSSGWSPWAYLNMP